MWMLDHTYLEELVEQMAPTASLDAQHNAAYILAGIVRGNFSPLVIHMTQKPSIMKQIFQYAFVPADTTMVSWPSTTYVFAAALWHPPHRDEIALFQLSQLCSRHKLVLKTQETADRLIEEGSKINTDTISLLLFCELSFPSSGSLHCCYNKIKSWECSQSLNIYLNRHVRMHASSGWHGKAFMFFLMDSAKALIYICCLGLMQYRFLPIGFYKLGKWVKLMLFHVQENDAPLWKQSGAFGVLFEPLPRRRPVCSSWSSHPWPPPLQ